MALVVQKFGGTSVGSVERIQKVVSHVLDCYEKGTSLVVVCSAMAGETNRLVELARSVEPDPQSHEYDVLLASGEQASVGLIALAMNAEARKRKLSVRGVPLLAYQIGMKTDQTFSKARIESIDTTRVKKELAEDRIPVIAGFQGLDSEGRITTLGRGGTDTSAVAIAAALQAEDCEIYTDVDGVYTTDPRMLSKARLIPEISYDEMMEFAGLGAKVLQTRSVEIAAKFDVPIHVRSSLTLREGTRVVSKEKLSGGMEEVLVSGVIADQNQVKVSLSNLPDRVDALAKIFDVLSKASVVVDVIVQGVSLRNLSFTVAETDVSKTEKALKNLKVEGFQDLEFEFQKKLAKVSIVGVGMQHHPGVAQKMFQILAENKVRVFVVSTSEIKVSCLVENDKCAPAVEALHGGFGLN